MHGKHINTLIAATIASTFHFTNSSRFAAQVSSFPYLYKAFLREASNTATFTSSLLSHPVPTNFPATPWTLPRRRDEHSLKTRSEFSERYTTPPRCIVQLPPSNLHIAATSRPPTPCRGRRSLVAQSPRSAVATVAGNKFIAPAHCRVRT